MADAPQPTLLERMNARFQKMRVKDTTIARFDREVTRHRGKMRHYHQLIKVARMAIREQERWLREEAAAEIRREAGVQTIPGFTSRRESAIEFRKKIQEKYTAAARASAAALRSPSP